MSLPKKVSRSGRLQRLPRLWKLIGLVTVGHVLAILILSPQFYCSRSNTPESLFAAGERAMAEGKHAEAMQLFRRVMDQQPKPPPIYARAAEQHRLADRLARQAAGQAAAESEAAKSKSPEDTKPVPASPATQPAAAKEEPKSNDPFIPPELRK